MSELPTTDVTVAVSAAGFTINPSSLSFAGTDVSLSKSFVATPTQGGATTIAFSVSGTDRAWFGTPPDVDVSVTALCATLSAPSNTAATGTCSGASSGDVCSHACIAYHSAVGGNAGRACTEGGTWSGSDLVCAPLVAPSSAALAAGDAALTLSWARRRPRP